MFSPEGTKSVSLDVSHLIPPLVSCLIFLTYFLYYMCFHVIVSVNCLTHGYLFDCLIKCVKSFLLGMLDRSVSLQPTLNLSSETL